MPKLTRKSSNFNVIRISEIRYKLLVLQIHGLYGSMDFISLRKSEFLKYPVLHTREKG